jgi:hypothetical protein
MAKKRDTKTGAKGKAATRRAAELPKERSQSFYDRIAIVLAAIGLVVLFSLTVPNSGVLGGALRDGLRLLFGNGAYLLPVVLWLAAGALVFGYGKLSLPEVIGGGLLIYGVLLGWMAQPRIEIGRLVPSGRAESHRRLPGRRDWFPLPDGTGRGA